MSVEPVHYTELDRARHARERADALATGERMFAKQAPAQRPPPPSTVASADSVAALQSDATVVAGDHAVVGDSGPTPDQKQHRPVATSSIARLSRRDLHMLRASGLSDETIAAAGFFTTTDAKAIDRVMKRPLSRGPFIVDGKLQRTPISALAIPILRPGEDKPCGHRFRLHHPRPKSERDTNGKLHYLLDDDGAFRGVKYESASKRRPGVYYPFDSRALDALGDASRPIVIVEGEKKACCLAQCGLLVIGLTGIWNFGDAPARREYRTQNPGHDRWALHPDIARFVQFRDRDVTICFDWSERPDPDEPKAALKLAQLLQGLGARAKYITPPSAASKGVDDFFVMHALRCGDETRAHDLTVDAALALDLERGKRATLELLASARTIPPTMRQTTADEHVARAATPKRSNGHASGDRVDVEGGGDVGSRGGAGHRAAGSYDDDNHEPALLPLDPLPSGVDRFGGLANAYRLAREHGSDIRYDTANGFTAFTGSCWRQNEGEANRRALDVCRRLMRYARSLAAAKPKDKAAREVAKQYLDHARKSQREPEVRHALAVARHLPPISTTPDVWDHDQWAFACANGVVDLRSIKLREHRRDDMIMRCSPVTFDPQADAPTWRSMLERILPDADVRAFVQRFVGYSLTGSTQEQCLAILWGLGANGKSTFVEALRHVMGSYAMATSTDTLMASRGSRGPENELARLRGARLVTAVESGETRRLDEERIKALTGGDMVSARFLYHEFFEFRPQFKLLLAVNDKPEIRGVDLGIWRRVRLVPFNVSIPPSEQDPALKDKLLAEAPGILRWAVDGCLSWQREGLQQPAAVTAATTEWRAESNVVAQFIDEACESASYASAKAGPLYRAFSEWARAQGMEPMSQVAFGKRLAALGLKADRGSHGTRTWRGVGLRADGFDQRVTGDAL